MRHENILLYCTVYFSTFLRAGIMIRNFSCEKPKTILLLAVHSTYISQNTVEPVP